MARLTKRRIDAAKPSDSDFFLWCESTPGFGARVYPSGKVIFVAQVRVGRSQRRIRIGVYGPWTVEQARTEAEGLIRQASKGEDPQAAKREARDSLTVAELCDKYLEAADAGQVLTRFGRPKAASTIDNDKGRISRHIKPLIGRIRARDLSRPRVQELVDDIAKGKTSGSFKSEKVRGRARVTGGFGTAARVSELLGGIYSWAEKRGYVLEGHNPVRGVERVRSVPKDRVLSPVELEALGKAIEDARANSPKAALAVELIALTGLRRQEAVGLRWLEIDKLGHCLRLAETKTGRSNRPLTRTVQQVLDRIPQTNRTYVFPNSVGTGPATLKKQIAAIFDRAGLSDARSHDLRRTFASTAAELGYGDGVIGELLGHSPRGVTGRHYIRRPDPALLAAADATASLIQNRLLGTPSAEVVDFGLQAQPTGE